MDIIHSKDIYYIVRDILKLMDPRVMKHGQRTAYILYKMLMCLDKYEMYEIEEFAFIATLHDIGTYKTDYMSDHLRYESRDSMPHSIYGYLFLQYLTPFADRAKIILYHHTDYNQVPKTDYEFTDIIHYLNVAEKMDIYSNILGSKFDYMMFQKSSGTKYAPHALELLYTAEKRFGIFDKLFSGEYEKELDELFEYSIFTNEEKEKSLFGLMHCVGFRSEYTMTDTVTCVHICEQIGEKLLLSKGDIELLRYAALFHDAGMCAIPKDVIEAPRQLTVQEMTGLRKHVEIIEEILKGKIDPDCLSIISAHHERGDGSGYPKRLKNFNMNRLQMILQVADTVTALTGQRSYRESMNKNQVIAILKEDADKGRYSKEVVTTFVNFYDVIMEGVARENAKALSQYRKMVEKYEITYQQIEKQAKGN